MQANRIIALAAVAVLVTGTGASAQGRNPQDNRVLARALLAQAIAAAKKWHADAQLFQIGASRITDGKAMWDFGFHSPSAPKTKNCALVNVIPSGQSNIQESDKCETDALKYQDFIDSDKALDLARKAGITRPEVSMYVSNSMHPKSSGVTWNIMDGGGAQSGDVIVELDGKTGALISKIKQK